MKYIFSFILFISNANSELIKIYSYNMSDGFLTKEIMMSKYLIPELNFDIIESKTKCNKVEKIQNKIILCTNKSGTLNIVSAPKEIIKSLNSFRN